MRAPQRDGVPAPANPDPLDRQLYTFDGRQDPDTSPDPAVPVSLGVGGGLLHAHVGLTGFISGVLDGTTSAGALSARQAEGFLANLMDPLVELSQGG